MLRQLCLIISGAICTDMLRKNRLGYYHASFCLAVVVFLIIFQMDSAVFLPDWGYASRDINEVQQLPPTKWSDRYPRCNGTRQSPISINSSTAQADGSLTEVGYYNYAARAVDDLWTIANTGHVVLFSGNFKNTPGIHSAGLSIPYFFQQMHFHWGAVNNRGSEHVIDGRRYPLELHIVHRSHDEMEHWQPYDITSSSDSIGTAVIAVMFELAQEGDEKNEHLDRLFHALAAATLIDSAPINISLPELTLFDLLPQHQSYYRYIGSLTTPPCAEAVIWTVMEQPLKVTEEQLEIFRHLRETVEYYPPVEHVDVVAKKSERDVEIVDNFRPLQDLNKRIVTHFAVATSNPPEAETVSKGHRYRLKGRNSGVLLIVLVFCIITRKFFGYRRNPVKLVLTWISIICTCGIVRLIFYWMRHWMLQCTHSLCTLEHADYVLLKNTYDQWFVCKVKSLRTDAERARRTAATEQRPSVPSVSESVDSSVVYPKENGKFEGVDDIRYFDDRRIRYIWNTESKAFVRLLGLDQHLSAEYFQTCSPLNSSEVQQRRLLYQSNEINIEVSPIIKILFKEVLNPFYIFQIFSISLWFSYGYYYYAGAILITTLCSLALTVHQLRKMQQMLQERAHAEETVTVCRPGAQTETVGSEQLVPGDIIQIPALGCQVLCDVILIAGSAIVNESALTGESVPVTKTAIPDCSGPFGIKEYQRHMVFSGTRVLQTRYYANEPVRAVVLRTGFATNKGNLIRSIMYPKPVDFKFYRHTYYFIIVLAAIALCGLIYSAILRAMRGQAVSEIIIRSLDVITIAVPPALPAALSVGIIYAQRRLQKNRIFCLSPRSINICGSVNLICFDKTGTLTQDGLDMKCVLPSQKSSFEEAITNPKEMPSSRIKDCMVACHSLTVIQGQTCGDPVDLIMFNSLSWSLMEPDVNEEARFDLVAPTLVTGPKCDTESDTIGIIKDFPFASSLQRMSTVIRRVKDEEFSYLMKGSPEKVITLCLPDTVPDNYFEQLESFTRHGDRVLALAWKPLNKMRLVKIQKLLREDLDKEMIFLGFVVMENRLKTDTKSVLEQIHNANIRTVMVTGDNMHTAISVARDCGMIRKWDDVHIITAGETNVFWTQAERPVQSFSLSIGSADKISSPTEIINLPTIHGAVSGESFSRIRSDHPQVLKKMLAHGTVFARMSPNEKERLVEDFQEAGYFVAMCGDGANDCGALKAAHAGVSLSESEAAAAAPFTACTGSIGCVPEIIKEGRAALVTSFGIFKYMAGYSLTQFFSVIVLYSIATNFSDLQFTYVDIFQVLILSATFGRSKAHPHLSRTPPPTSLITFVPLFSLFSQVIIVFGFQLAAFFIAYLEKDSTSYENMYANGGGTPPFFSKENFAVFAVSSFQYVWLALAFAKGPPYRKILLKNRIFCLTALGMVAFDMFLLLGPTEPMKWLLELQVPELWNRKLTFLFLAFCNGIIAILFEKIVVDYVIFRKLGTRFKFLRNVRTHQDVTRDLLNTMPDDWWHELERKPLGQLPQQGSFVIAPPLATTSSTAALTENAV